MTGPPNKTKDRRSNLFEGTWLPRRPYAADDYEEGIYQMTRERALTKSHIQVNAPSLSNLLVVDIDEPDAVVRALWDRDGWRPNWIAENPANGHAHAMWAIEAPVCTSVAGRARPRLYYDAVTEGLRRSVGGDDGYAGFTMKNPLHDRWNVLENNDRLFALEDLEHHLSAQGFMPPHTWRRKRRRAAGTQINAEAGRNSALYLTIITWISRELRHHWGDAAGLREATQLAAMQMNVDLFEVPLDQREVARVANSAVKWVTTKSDMWTKGREAYEETFRQIQTARSRRAAVKRTTDAKEAEAALWEIIGD